MRSLLITGATGNLGRRIIPALSEDWDCAALYRDEAAWLRLRDASPSSLRGIRCDLADQAEIERAFAEAAPSHVLHLAGGWFGGSIRDTDDETWMAAFDSNLHPAFRILRASLGHLDSEGSATFLSSIGVSELRAGMASYIVAKSALETLVKLGAAEGAAIGIRVNAIAPDTIGDTPGQVSPDRILDAIRSVIAGTANGEIVKLQGV